jgi:hypothetical protein
MGRFLLAATFWISVALSAFGDSVEIPVTPRTPEQGGYLFLVLTNPVQDGTAFRATITRKSEIISSDSTVALCLVTPRMNGFEIHPLKPDIKITLKKENYIWRANFILSTELLKNPDLYLIYTECGHMVVSGKTVPMPSAAFYEMKLRDFMKQ